MQINYNRRNQSLSNTTPKTANIILVIAVMLLIFSGWAWMHFVRSNVENTFYGMVENNLSTAGVTRLITQNNGNQALNQSVQLSLGSQDAARGVTDIKQTGAVSAAVQTENISTPSADFVRYTNIQTDQKSATGKNLDFSKLLNIWGKTDLGASSQAVGELFGESVMGAVPTGNLSPANRKELMNLIMDKKVYSFKADKVKKQIKNNRPVYTYDVSIAPQAYVTMLKQYASSIGLKQLESVDPANYKDSQPISFTLDVDVWSRQLIKVEQTGANRSEVLSGHGYTPKVDIPKKYIDVQELQAKLQAVQQ